MKTLRSFAHGLGRALVEPRLALVLWAWSALLTLPVAAPIWRVWRNTTANAPRADALLEGLNLVAFGELTKHDVTSPWNLAIATLGGVTVLAALGQALAAGGTLEVLLASERGPFLRRFLAGAGGFFWRFLRVFVVAAVAAGVSLGAVALAFQPLSRIAGESAWEPGWYLMQLARAALLALVALFWLIAVDYARIRLALDRDRRSALLALVRAAALVARHPLRAYGIWVIGGLLVGALFAGYGAFRSARAADTGALILLMVGAQQLVMVLRAGIRVSVIGAEVHATRQLRTAATVQPLTPAPPADEPPPVEPAAGPAEASGPHDLDL